MAFAVNFLFEIFIHKKNHFIFPSSQIIKLNFLFTFLEFLDPAVVELYLKYNPKFLDDFVSVNIRRSHILKWLEGKTIETKEKAMATGAICKCHNIVTNSQS